MEIDELAAYAENKYRMKAQHKWESLPSLSVLTDPSSGKWIALLIKEWNGEQGEYIERCDMRCASLIKDHKSWLTKPFRMSGNEWIGIRIDQVQNADEVFHLFDAAVRSVRNDRFTIVIPSDRTSADYPSSAIPSVKSIYNDAVKGIPEPIVKMMELYQYGSGSFSDKCRNFYTQGKYMADYEDNVPWVFVHQNYFVTYHDLNVTQLRGYFTWRSKIRRKEYPPASASLAYLYIYELLNEIGTKSEQDAFQKMEEFDQEYVRKNDERIIANNLHQWMADFCIVHHFSAEITRKYMKPYQLELDMKLTPLKSPQDYSDEEIVASLSYFSKYPFSSSPVMKDKEKGIRLFASLWRIASRECLINNKELFTVCFGQPSPSPYHPFNNAVYYEEKPYVDMTYAADPLRQYRCRDGKWTVSNYEKLYFDLNWLNGLLHDADRQFRRYCKTGGYLRTRTSEKWAIPYGEKAIEAEEQYELEASRPKITIDFSSLDHIRKDAAVTRDSLLTEEEKETDTLPVQAEVQPETEADEVKKILKLLINGDSAQKYILEKHVMPSVICDRINEALFDEIGDNAVEYDGTDIHLVEDYRDEIIHLLGGDKNG